MCPAAEVKREDHLCYARLQESQVGLLWESELLSNSHKMPTSISYADLTELLAKKGLHEMKGSVPMLFALITVHTTRLESKITSRNSWVMERAEAR